MKNNAYNAETGQPLENEDTKYSDEQYEPKEQTDVNKIDRETGRIGDSNDYINQDGSVTRNVGEVGQQDMGHSV